MCACFFKPNHRLQLRGLAAQLGQLTVHARCYVPAPLKTISVYGLSLDHVVPLQLYKLRMNFEKKKVEVFRKVACEHGPIPSRTVDCLISYMIRNISECNM